MRTMYQKTAAGEEFSSLGMLIPFQPYLWDTHSLYAILNSAIDMVKEKMEGHYNPECIREVIARLKKLFSGLNFNTHRQSLAIMLTREEEKLIYINYPVQPMVVFGKTISCLHLAASMQPEQSFYVLAFQKNTARIYEYTPKKLTRVYEPFHFTSEAGLFRNAKAAIELLNDHNQKPVFVTGNQHMVSHFCREMSDSNTCFPLAYEAYPDHEKVASLAQEITARWDYWHAAFTAARLRLAQKTSSLITDIETVMHALQKGAGGLLLIDRKLNNQLPSPKGNILTHIAAELINHLERFLANGNRIQVTETELLHHFGGIALVQKNRVHSPQALLRQKTEEHGGKDHVF